ncbi:MAG TPA: bifunctional DNA primase/polymerase [Nitrospirales bacterium]|nr:bifunctional DNA primase/polymerase [Nitrospirales bacterium]
MSASDLATAAAEYHSHGWPVVPVNADKEAMTRFKQWKQRPQTAQEVRDFSWTRLHGLALLTWPYSDLVVLDFDGPHAEQVWHEQTGLALPDTATTRTGGGWTHRIYRVPPGTPRPRTPHLADHKRKIRLEMEAVPCGALRDKRTGKVKACGVDLLLNGYFVAPPTPGYREDPDHPFEPGNIATIPPAVLNLARRKDPAAPQITEPTDGDWFAAAVRGPVLGGGRNETANKLAFLMFKDRLPRHRVTPILELWAAKACDPPLTGDRDEMKKLHGTIQSAEEAAKRETAKPDTPAALPSLDAPVAVLRKSQNQGDPIPTGLPVLDARLRGGMRPGKALVIGGTPFAGKTALSIQIAKAAVDHGCVAACLMTDEGRESAIIRLGQQLGYARADLESGDEPTLDAMERDLAGQAILFPDPDGEGDLTLEGVAEALVKAYPDRRKLLLVDSVQTVRTRRPEGDQPSLRERVMENARTARRLAVEYGLVTVYTSEVHRGWYRNRKVEDRSTDLAAFAEARIEFSGDTLLLLRANEEDTDLVEIRIPKNRLGTRQPFFLRMQQQRSLFAVVDGDPSAAMRNAAEEQLIEKQVQGILQALQKSPGLTQTHLKDVVGGNRQAFLAALRRVKETGLVTWRQDGRSIRHYLTEVPK